MKVSRKMSKFLTDTLNCKQKFVHIFLFQRILHLCLFYRKKHLFWLSLPPLPVTDWSVVYIIFTPSYSILLETKTIASYTNMNPRNNKDLTRKRTRLCRLKSAVSSFNRVRSRTLKCVLQNYVYYW